MLDALLIFDPSGTPITVSAPSTNVLDFLTQRDVGAGDDIEIHVDIQTAFTATGSATLQVKFQGSPDNTNWYDMVLSPVIGKAALVAGAPLFRYKFPINQLLEGGAGGQTNVNPTGSPLRYGRLDYVVATGPMTAGTVYSYLSGAGDRVVYYTYPRNYNVGA